MSEDSIASESLLSLPHRGMDAGADASLPPRKRLLAGFKQNGWSSPSPSSSSSSSSSSSYSASSFSSPPVLPTRDSSELRVKSHLDRLSVEKPEDLGQNSAEIRDRSGQGNVNGNCDVNGMANTDDGNGKADGSRNTDHEKADGNRNADYGSGNGDRDVNTDGGENGQGNGGAKVLEESAVSDYRIILRKSKRFCVDSSAVKGPKKTKKSLVKDVKNNSSEEKDPQRKAFFEKDEAITLEISVEMALLSEERVPERDTVSLAKSSEEEEEEEVDDDDDDNHGAQPNDKIKPVKVIADDGLKLEKVKEEEEESLTIACGLGMKPRRNPSRMNHSKSKFLCKKQEAQIEKSLKSSHTTPSLSDEELARELHRAMNSSPRISRCHNYKDGPLLSLNR